MVVECVCCDVRMDLKSRRPFHGLAMRLFVSARRNKHVPEEGFICNGCRMSYSKWRENPDFSKMLNQIEIISNENMENNDQRVTLLASVPVLCSLLCLE